MLKWMFRRTMIQELKDTVYEECLICRHSEDRESEYPSFICDKCGSSQFINGAGGITVNPPICDNFYTGDRGIFDFFAELAYWRGVMGYD